MSFTPKPLVLIILDGWGYRQDTQYNAIAAARKPTWDMLWKQYPHTLIHASEAAVGLPSSQIGNSEVGHLNIGAGRVVYQEYTRINRAISTGTFFTNKTLTDAIDLALKTGSAVHIMCLPSRNWRRAAAPPGFICTPFLTAATPHRKARPPRSRRCRKNSPLSSTAASPRSSAATTPWTAITAGRAFRPPTTSWRRARRNSRRRPRRRRWKWPTLAAKPMNS